jgi:hypothetical protein
MTGTAVAGDHADDDRLVLLALAVDDAFPPATAALAALWPADQLDRPANPVTPTTWRPTS